MDWLIQAESYGSFSGIPERTALINVDMQNCFFEVSPFSASDRLEVLVRSNWVAASCRVAAIVVIQPSTFSQRNIKPARKK